MSEEPYRPHDLAHELDDLSAAYAQAQAELARLRTDLDTLRENFEQQGRALAATDRARQVAEADAGAIRIAAQTFAHIVDQQIGSSTDPAILVLRLALNDMNRVLADEHPGAQLLAELELLRELADDVRRWRESGGDTRDQAYMLETLTKIEKARE